MSVPCNASVTWFREPGHVMIDDKCVLENGHEDYEHLPAGKAGEQVETRVWNVAVDTMAAAVITHLHDRLKMTDAFDLDMLTSVMVGIAAEVKR